LESERAGYTGCRASCSWVQGDLGSWIDVNDRGRGAEGSEGRTEFTDFQFRESTFRWEGGVGPFQFCQRPNWYELTLMDAQEQVEAPRSTLRESRPSKKFPNFMALICYIIEEATVHRCSRMP
jgi:hypothetical protein